MRKALFIGGTGTISTAISHLAIREGWELTLLNRGGRPDRTPEGARSIRADIGDEASVAKLLADETFEVVADFIAFTPAQVARDIRLFAGRVKQFIFISSASAYQKPLSSPFITESTPLCNPYWQYSRDKIACEELLTRAYREDGFPMTIVRPSHTYCAGAMPLGVHGDGAWSLISRMLRGLPVIVPGDGATLWTVTWSEDFAPGFLGLMGNVHAIGEAYHITSDESLTWNQIHRIVGDAFGVEPRIVHVTTDDIVRFDPSYDGPLNGDKSHTVIFDNAKIKRAVPGFHCPTRFDAGARLSAQYMLAHDACRKEDPAFDAWCERLLRTTGHADA